MDNNQTPNAQKPETGAAKPAAAGGKPVRQMPDFGEMFKNIKMPTLLIILGVVTGLLILFQVYFGLMSFAIDSIGLRVGIILLALLWTIPFVVYFMKANNNGEPKSKKKKVESFKSVHWGWKIPAAISVVVVLISICLAIFTTPLFLAKDFNKLIEPEVKSEIVNDAGDTVKAFNEEIPDYFAETDPEQEMKVAIIDKSFAAQLGVKVLGAGTGGLGSQYTIKDYTLIHYEDGLYWAGALEPKGFFQWTSSTEGSPGYVLVDATEGTDDSKRAKLVQTHKIKYNPGAYLWNDVERSMYFAAPGSLRSPQLNFEIDDAGVPYYTQAIYKKEFGITSGDVVTGLLVLNATTGETKHYAIDKVPAWIDRVQVDSITMNQLDYWGEYTQGYWNTVFAKSEVNATTKGYNYVYYNDTLHLTTGFTSKSTTDDAIIGTIMVDMKTNKAVMYNMSGATEAAAMKAAEGIQEAAAAGYKATFPALVNFNGVPTYYMTLKDSSNNIKMYAYVSVEKYTTNLVANKDASAAALAYNKIIGGDEKPVPPVAEGVEKDLAIDTIISYTLSGNTMFSIMVGNIEYTANISIKGGNLLLRADKDSTIKVKVVGNTITEVISVA